VRTTLTLDTDVDAKLRTEARRSGKPFKAVVNDCLRMGLSIRSQAKAVKPFVVKARSLGSKGFNYDNIEELLDKIEGPFHK
jgi:hypothetical protein